MGGLLDRYPRGPAYDEMFGADGLPHPHTRALYDALQTLTGDDLARRAEARDRSFRDQGVTFSHAGEEWLFPLDLIPRLIPAAEWELVEAGVVQRVRALEAFLADVYGPAEVVRDGVVPRSLLATSAGFCRAAHGIRTAERRAGPPRRDRSRPRPGRGAAGTRGQPAGTVRHVLCGGEPAGPWLASFRACSWSSRCGRSPPIRGGCSTRCAGRRRSAPRSPPWCCSPPAWTTRPTSSTPSWPARWASSWSRAGICSAATISCTCAASEGSGGWTSSTGASTTTFSIRSISGPTPSWGARGS